MARRTYRRKSRKVSRRRSRRYVRPGRAVGTRSKFGNVHHFKRRFTLATITCNSTSYTAGSYAFKLSDMNYSDFTGLFDQYRINKLVVKFIPTFSGTELGPTTIAPMPNLHTVIDYDSGGAGTYAELQQYETYRYTQGNKPHTRVFTPCVLTTIGTATGSGVKFKQWIDCAFTEVLHYGLRYIGDQTSWNAGGWTPLVTVYFSMRGVR